VTSSTGARRGRPTLDAVAARAGVSRATASRVVNGSATVAPAVRLAVQRAIEELGYTPNLAARALASRRSDTATVVIAEPPAEAFACPILGELIDGARRELRRSSWGLRVVVTAPSEPDFRSYQAQLTGGHEDGVILLSLRRGNPLPGALARAGVPAVTFGRVPDPTPALPYVDSANRDGAEQAVRWLLGLGRTRIATIAGPRDMPSGVERLDGYRAALGDRFRPSLVEPGDYREPTGERAMAALLAREPDLDAVFVANDFMAFGALRALHAAGRTVPDDVALVGFDDVDRCDRAEPALTTIRQPIAQIGRELVRLLRARWEGTAAAAGPVILPTELVVRQSA
jgi:DNA-binding LacI/PurR family transcriptional regulator